MAKRSAGDLGSWSRKLSWRPKLAQALPVRNIGVVDIRIALRRGFDDFWAKPSHLFFLGLIYPAFGLFVGNIVLEYRIFPMLFPLVAGLALVGPFVALGLYEVSRQRELGREPTWTQVLALRTHPSRGKILELGLFLTALYFAWLVAAILLFRWIFGPTMPATILGFVHDVLFTRRGWALMVIGNGVGLLFAAAVLLVSVVSFPLLLDRRISVDAAMATSMQAVLVNPWPMTAWGLVVAAGILAGALTLFVGLALTVPILGHATWHLYRAVVPPVG
ncbi:DUF2189 domain-containing protein [Alsobacter sp. SYSU BS001988]